MIKKLTQKGLLCVTIVVAVCSIAARAQKVDLAFRNAVYVTSSPNNLNPSTDPYASADYPLDLSASKALAFTNGKYSFYIGVVITRNGPASLSAGGAVLCCTTNDSSQNFTVAFKLSPTEPSKEVVFPVHLSPGDNTISLVLHDSHNDDPNCDNNALKVKIHVQAQGPQIRKPVDITTTGAVYLRKNSTTKDKGPDTVLHDGERGVLVESHNDNCGKPNDHGDRVCKYGMLAIFKRLNHNEAENVDWDLWVDGKPRGYFHIAFAQGKQEFGFAFAAMLSGGHHKLQLVIDPKNKIHESDENNNSLSWSVDILQSSITDK